MRTNKKNNIVSFLRYYNENNSTLNDKQKKMLNDVYPLINTRKMALDMVEDYFKKYGAFPFGTKYRELIGFIRNNIKKDDLKLLLNKYNITCPEKRIKKKPITYSEVLSLIIKNKGLGEHTIGKAASRYIRQNNNLDKIKEDLFNSLKKSTNHIDQIISFIIKNKHVPIPSKTDANIMDIYIKYSKLSVPEKLAVRSFSTEKYKSDIELRQALDFILENNRTPTKCKDIYENGMYLIYQNNKETILKLISEQTTEFNINNALINNRLYKRLNLFISFIKENNRLPAVQDGKIYSNFMKFKRNYPEHFQSILDDFPNAVINTKVLKQQNLKIKNTGETIKL